MLWKCFISALNDVSSAPSFPFSGHQSYNKAAVKNHAEDHSFTPVFHRPLKNAIIVCPLRCWEWRRNVFFSINGQHFLSSSCVVLAFDHSCFTSVVIISVLKPGWILLLTSGYSPCSLHCLPSDQQLLLCLETHFITVSFWYQLLETCKIAFLPPASICWATRLQRCPFLKF